MEELVRKRFKNITKGKQIIKEKMKEIGCGNTFMWKSLERLVKFHPEKKINEVEYFVIRERPPYMNEAIYYKEEGKEEDCISINMCLRNIFGKIDFKKEKRKDILQALRNSIKDGARMDFINSKSNCENVCENCKATGKMFIDHYPIPFIDLVNGYCKYKGIELESLNTIYVDNVYCLDINEDEDFRKYHDSLAKYRFLCPMCNSRFGDYKRYRIQTD